MKLTQNLENRTRKSSSKINFEENRKLALLALNPQTPHNVCKGSSETFEFIDIRYSITRIFIFKLGAVRQWENVTGALVKTKSK